MIDVKRIRGGGGPEEEVRLHGEGRVLPAIHNNTVKMQIKTRNAEIATFKIPLLFEIHKMFCVHPAFNTK